MNGKDIITSNDNQPSSMSQYNIHYNKKYNEIRCSQCHFLSQVKIIKEKEEIIIEMTCKNNHIEKLSLLNFIKKYENSYIINCPLCCNEFNISMIFYCFSCQEIFCENCKNKHLLKEDIPNGNTHIIDHFTSIEKKCCFHNYNENELYCNICKKLICKKCFEKAHNKHIIIDLSSNFDKIEIELDSKLKDKENLIEKEKKEYNNMLVKIRNKLFEIIQYKENILNLKKFILNSYKKKNLNYFNTKNINLIRNYLYNKNNVENNVRKLCYICNIKNTLYNYNYKRFDNKNRYSYGGNKTEIKCSSRKLKSFKDKFNYNNEFSSPKKNSLKLNKSINSNKAIFKIKYNNLNLDLNKNTNIDSNKKNCQNNNNKDNKSLRDIFISLEDNNLFYNNESAFSENYIDKNDSKINEEDKNIKNFNTKSYNINEKTNNIIDINRKNNSNNRENYYKIFHTKKNIKKIFCLSHNNIIISFLDYINLSMNKIIQDENEYIKIKHLKYIKINNEQITDINLFPNNQTLLICSSSNIIKLRIINHENGDYVILFNYINNISSHYKIKIKMNLPLSNDNFMTCGEMNSIFYWKKEKQVNLNMNEEKYKSMGLNLKNYNNEIISMKEIYDNLIVIYIVIKNKGIESYYLLYLEINDRIKLKNSNKIEFELSKEKNSIRKINDDYFLILLQKEGFIIINRKTREISKKIIDKNKIFYFLESKLFDNYLYYYVIQKNVNDNKLIFTQYNINILDNLINDKTNINSGKEFCLNFRQKINDIGIIFHVKEDNNNHIGYYKEDFHNIQVILVLGNNQILIFNYYS